MIASARTIPTREDRFLEMLPQMSASMFGSFLSWLNDHESVVFLVCTANDVAKLPPEFSRAERFDATFFLAEIDGARVWLGSPPHPIPLPRKAGGEGTLLLPGVRGTSPPTTLRRRGHSGWGRVGEDGGIGPTCGRRLSGDGSAQRRSGSIVCPESALVGLWLCEPFGMMPESRLERVFPVRAHDGYAD